MIRVSPIVCASFALSAFSIGGCQCGEVSLDIPTDKTITVPGTGIDVGNNPLAPDEVFPAGTLSQALAESLTQSLNTSGYKKEAVTSLKLTVMSLEVTDDGDGPPEGLECFSSLIMHIGASEEDDVKVAESAPGAFDGTPGPTSYDMVLSGEDINPFLQKADALVVTADVEPGVRPLVDIDVRISFVMTALVEAFKAL